MDSFIRRGFPLSGTAFVIALLAGCSAPAESPSTSSDGDAGHVGSDAGSDAFKFDTESADSGAAADARLADTAPACVPTSDVDEPDDDFKDTNCDGIDGDKKFAVFVATTGSDDAAGTMDAPFKTIGKAIKTGKDVYVCNGTYAENLVVGSYARVYGGYDCADGWKRTLERATIAPTKGVPLSITKSSKSTFDRITLRAPDGVDPGESSIAAIVSESTEIVFRNSRLLAGSAADGRAPELVAAVTTAATAGVNGESVGATTCRTFMTISPPSCILQSKGGFGTSSSTCESAGGRGGDGGLWAQRTDARLPATAGAAGQYGSKGGKVPSSAGAGLPGSPGDDGATGVSSTSSFGTISVSGYYAGNEGSDGLPGTGGGGGGGGWGGAGNWERPLDVAPDYFYNGGGGGQGGFGGCGGAAGKKGGGGGASIALLSLGSQITLSKTTLDTGSGGRGGAGGAGAEGQPGGMPGLGGRSTDRRDPPAGNGYDGGPGGRGGHGGAGGAGGGGPSIAIVFKGTEPSRDAVTFNLGKPGKGGLSAAGAAVDGVGKDVFEVK